MLFYLSTKKRDREEEEEGIFTLLEVDQKPALSLF
jgi:hypothetical protein